LEEEYTHISKSHEEEIELRMKFESKLNSITTDHKELNIKYDRSKINYKKAKETLRQANGKIYDQGLDLIELKK